MQIKLVILDFDGTLGDTRKNIIKTLQMTLKEMNYPVPSEDECGKTIGLVLKNAFIKLCNISEIEAELCVKKYKHIFAENKKILIPQLFSGVKETLAAFKKQNILISIASSRTSVSLKEFVDEMGLSEYINFILGAEDVKNPKPNAEPVLKTLKHFKIAPENALVVGDMPYDILMGKNANSFACGVTYGNGKKQDLISAGADFIIDNFADLQKIVF